MDFDLLDLVQTGGCSIKLPAEKLKEALKDLPVLSHERLLVDIGTYDDAGVYKLNDDTALIQTTDFFSPVCSDPYEFGQIAAANALSDVYAMGGEAITALNLVMFPPTISLNVLKEILRGGTNKVEESGAVIVGGHTITDFPPKYGLAVTGLVHPEKIIVNSRAESGDKLVLTKPLGTGVIMAGKRLGEIDEESYHDALSYMKLLNKNTAKVMQECDVRCATDITGFGLLGHLLHMANGSRVSITIASGNVPLLKNARELTEKGCIPTASFRNQDFAEKNCFFARDLDYSIKMLLFDAQTSGGIVMTVKEDNADNVIRRLKQEGCPESSIIGEVIDQKEYNLYVS